VAILPMSDFKQRGVDLALDIGKQFLALALGGVAFAIGITAKDNGSVASGLFWAVIALFGSSLLFGFLFLMHGVSRLYQDSELDPYARFPRMASLLQIVSVMLATVFLLLLHLHTLGHEKAKEMTKVKIVRDGKETTLVVEPGRELTASVAPDGSIATSVK
jgi:hypothetical protein